ncbi:MAG: tRNA adenosine(34) deaminase TadA [Zetaproteobacteria bacterium]|nr:MAG: tRNA adenosine(34) deaminase TadA [Zetaproteobacteria bacterium]
MRKHEHYMQQALKAAHQAARLGEVPVGAVLVLDDQVFVAHNAPISSHDSTAHAEIRVIRSACQALGNYRLPGSTLYVTLEPCCMCAGAIVHARIDHVIYGADDPKAGAVHSLYTLLSDPRLNHRPKLSRGILAEPCAEVLRNFFRERRKRT